MTKSTAKTLTLMFVIVALVALPLSITSADLAEGLVVYFSFDQGKADVVKDLSGTGNNGIVHGNPKWVQGPKKEFGRAIEFDGVSDYVEVLDNDTLDVGDGDISMVLWVKQAGEQVDHPRPISKMPLFGTNKPGFDLITVGAVSAQMQIFYGLSGADRQTVNAGQPLADGEWHHVAAMKDGREGKIYIDGELKVSSQFTPIDIDNDYPFVIGACAQIAAHVMFKGVVDEVAFYTRALTEDEVEEIMEINPFAAVEPEGKLPAAWGHIKRAYYTF